MRKTILWGALFTLISAQVQADAPSQPVQSPTLGSPTTPVTSNPGNQEPAVIQKNPNTQPLQGTQQGQSKIVQPEQNIQNPQQAQPVQQMPAVQAPTQSQVQTAPVINCDYKIPATTKTIDQSLVLTWSEKATTQAFDFDPANLDTQIQTLKACFTEQGWAGFSSALQKSGNLEAIKTQKLTVSSQIDGQTQITETKDNQWKITLPLQVVYQNDKEKVTQLLSVNLTVGRKVNGDLGIAQMIATPRTASQTTPDATAGSQTTPAAQAAPKTDSPAPTSTSVTNQSTPSAPMPH